MSVLYAQIEEQNSHHIHPLMFDYQFYLLFSFEQRPYIFRWPLFQGTIMEGSTYLSDRTLSIPTAGGSQITSKANYSKWPNKNWEAHK